MKAILIILFSCFALLNTCYSQDSKKLEVAPNSLDFPVQPSNSFWKTIYYDADWNPVKKKAEAVYYREPVIKNGDRYEVEYFRAGGKRYMTGSYIPQVVNYQLSLDEGIAIKDGHFVFYDEKGEKKCEGEYVQDKKAGDWACDDRLPLKK